MSYGIDLIIESSIDHAIGIMKAQGCADAGIWRTREGNEITIIAMTTGHIHNCVRMLKRNMAEYPPDFKDIAEQYISLFQEEIEKRYPPADPALIEG